MSAIDTSVLTDLERMGGSIVVEMMLGAAIPAMREQIEQLTRAADIGDLDGVAAAAHALVSSSGSVGATATCRAAQSIQSDAHGGLLDPANPEITGLRAHLEGFISEAEALHLHSREPRPTRLS